MKRAVVLLLSLLTLLTISSCEKETILTIDQSSLTVGDSAGSQTVSLTANKPWSVTSDQSWCKVSPSAGEEATSSRITISYDANTSYEARTATVTFTCAELTKTVSVSQATNNGLLVSQTSYDVTKAAQQIEIQVQANVKFSVEVDNGCKDWVKYNTTKGLTTSTIVLDIAENKTYDAREGKVTIKQEGGTLSETITISQAASEGLLLTNSEFNITNAAQQVNVEVKANVKFSVEVDESCKDWVKYSTTKSLTSSTVVLDVAKNEAYDGREGKVAIRQTGGDLSATVIIRQSQQNGLFITTPEYNLSNDHHTLTVEVKSNIEFDVKPEVGWIKNVETKGLQTNQIVLDISGNDTYEERQGRVRVIQRNGDLSGTIVINQDQRYGILVSQAEYDLSADEQTIDVEVKYNVAYDVSIPVSCQDWIRQVYVKSLDKRFYTFKIAKNGFNNREGSITFKQVGGGLSTSVTIRQGQNDYLEVSHKNYLVDIEGEVLSLKIMSNLDYSVSVAESAKSWIKLMDTKGLSIDDYIIAISAGKKTTDRTGEILIRAGSLTQTITIHQYSFDSNPIIEFVDPKVKEICVANWDTNKDGELSFEEASGVDNISNHFQGSSITSFEEFRFFTKLSFLSMFAFSDCSYLTSISLPDGISSVGSYAFNNCNTLVSISLPNGISSVGDGAFRFCNSLTSIELPESVKTMEDEIFSGCSSLTNLNLPEGLMSIGDRFFSNCKSLKSIELPQGLSSIPNSAFSGCSSLKSVTLPDGVTSIGEYAFSGCTELTFINLSSGLDSIPQHTFYNCTSLKRIDIPQGVSSIGRGAFENCSSLVEVTIPTSVTRIGDEAFRYCTSLPFIEIPQSVTSIGNFVLGSCYELSDYSIPSSLLKTMWEQDGIFWYCQKMTSVQIPEGVERIGMNALTGIRGLKEIVIPNSVKSIGVSAFQGTGIESIIVPESVTSIEAHAFNSCEQLQNVIIHSKIETIEPYTFQFCRSLVSIVLPRTVNSIGHGAFIGCGKLASIELPDGLIDLGDGVFEECSSLSTISIPATVTSIGVQVFLNCTNLSSVSLPNGLKSIGALCFYYCTKLAEINIPESITTIEPYTFYNCAKLQGIILPEGITSIGNSAFSYCRKLSSIIVRPTTPPSAGEDIFYGSNCNIQVPTSSVDAYKEAEGWRGYASRIVAM